MTSNSDQALRDLLAQVAAGTVAPEDASARLRETREPPSTHVRLTPQPGGSRAEAAPAPGPIDRVVVHGAAAKIVLVGDPTVAGASVEGPHVARREGGTLIVQTDGTPSEGDFAYESNRLGLFGRFNGGQTVVVRVRPELPVEVTVQASSAVATRLEGGLTFRVEAGSLTATDCSGVVDGTVQAGSAKLDWLFDTGQSKIRCELGSVKLRLDRRSNVKVRGRVEMGSLDLGSDPVTGIKAKSELVVGAGASDLEIAVELGSAKVKVA